MCVYVYVHVHVCISMYDYVLYKQNLGMDIK